MVPSKTKPLIYTQVWHTKIATFVTENLKPFSISIVLFSMASNLYLSDNHGTCDSLEKYICLQHLQDVSFVLIYVIVKFLRHSRISGFRCKLVVFHLNIFQNKWCCLFLVFIHMCPSANFQWGIANQMPLRKYALNEIYACSWFSSSCRTIKINWVIWKLSFFMNTFENFEMREFPLILTNRRNFTRSDI